MIGSVIIDCSLNADVVRLVLAEHDLVVPEVVLTELERVLATKLKLLKARIAEYLAFLREHEVIAKPARVLDLDVRTAPMAGSSPARWPGRRTYS